jgi:pimeloyl-ACP methyl ester carboxylesterase
MPFLSQQGHRLFYRQQGQGPLLLVLPGNTASSAHHAGELAYFGQRFHTVSPDYWGTGQSDRLASWPDDWYQQAAQDACALAAHLGEARCIAMGTSGGAVVALWMAILRPQQVRAVIADSTVETMPAAWLEMVMQERAKRTSGQVTFWQQAHGDDWSQVVEADSAMFVRAWSMRRSVFDSRLGEIACPVLLTASLADPMLPDVGAQTLHAAQQIPGCQVYLHTCGGHPLMWTQPADFRRICDSFIQSLPEEAV